MSHYVFKSKECKPAIARRWQQKILETAPPTFSLSHSVHRTPPRRTWLQDRRRRWSRVCCSHSYEGTPCSTSSIRRAVESAESLPYQPTTQTHNMNEQLLFLLTSYRCIHSGLTLEKISSVSLANFFSRSARG